MLKQIGGGEYLAELYRRGLIDLQDNTAINKNYYFFLSITFYNVKIFKNKNKEIFYE